MFVLLILVELMTITVKTLFSLLCNFPLLFDKF